MLKIYENDANDDNEDGRKTNFDQISSLQLPDQVSQKQVHKLDKDKSYIFLDCLGKCTFTKMMIVCLEFFYPHSRIFHPFGDVTITGEGLHMFTYARHLWPLSSE